MVAPTSPNGIDGRRQRSGGGDRKVEILRIAAELFARNGYHATGVAELGEAVGLGRGALYHHIGSKEQLLFEISSRHVVEMVAFGEVLLGSDVSPEEKFRRLSRRLMRTIADNLPELTTFFSEYRALSGERAEHLLDLRRRFEGIWTAILEEGVATGTFRSADPVVVKGLLGLHNYSYLWFDPDGQMSPEEVSDAFCDFALRGLLTAQAAAATS
jgi:AcrR family transcriptional regulator